MNPSHVLGKFRLPIVHCLAVVASVLAWNISENIYQALIYGAIGWVIFWVFTTEIMLKVSMSAVPAVITYFIAAHVTHMAFGPWDGVQGGKGSASAMIFNGFGPWIAMIGVWIWIYRILDKSSWIGTPCPHCHVRGKTDKEEIHKEYLGQKTEKSGGKWVTYNIYNVTYRNWCNSCGVEWQSSGERSERA